MVTLVAVGISLTLVLIGVFGAFAEPNVKSVDIPIMVSSGFIFNGLSRTFFLKKHDSSAKLVLLTDVHIGPSVGLRRTRSIADVVNSLNPGVLWFHILLLNRHRGNCWRSLGRLCERPQGCCESPVSFEVEVRGLLLHRFVFISQS